MRGKNARTTGSKKELGRDAVSYFSIEVCKRKEGQSSGLMGEKGWLSAQQFPGRGEMSVF